MIVSYDNKRLFIVLLNFADIYRHLQAKLYHYDLLLETMCNLEHYHQDKQHNTKR